MDNSLRLFLVAISFLIAIVSMVFTCVSVAGFSMNADVVRDTYWSGANLPKFDIGGYELEGYNIEYYYGLRLAVELCNGDRCDDSQSSYRIQSCDSVPSDSQQDVCNQCRSGGLAAGSFTILTLLFTLILTILVAMMFMVDNLGIKITAIISSIIVLLFSFLALTIYGAKCYEFIVANQYSDDDAIDQDDVEYFYGPGFTLLLIVLFLQLGQIILLSCIPTNSKGSNNDGGLANQENTA